MTESELLPPSFPPPDWPLLRSRTFRGMGLFMVFCLVSSALAIMAIARPHDPAEALLLVAVDLLVLGLALASAKALVSKFILAPIEGERARLKSAEKALALSRSEELFMSRLENMYEGCQIVDREFRYHFVNDAAAAQYRMPRGELLGRTMAEARPGIELTQLFDAVSSCLAGGQGRHFDSFLAFPDNTTTWFEFSVQPAPEGVFILSADISERKRADAEYLARQAAELANRTKSDFLANMSHELRTPLNSIIGFTEVLQDSLYGDLNQKQSEYLGFINTSGRHLLELINEILDLSKVQSGKMDVFPSTFRIRTLVELSITMLRGKAKEKRITIEIRVDPQADLEILSDERVIKQILFNLLSNAVKFTTNGGRIRVDLRRVDEPGCGIEVAVTDTGIGIKREDFGRLFTEFSQIDSPLQKRFDGTGLGLSLSKRLVELVGGTIRMESEEGVGSTFAIRLPLGLPAAPEHTTEKEMT